MSDRLPSHFAFYPAPGPPETVWIIFPTDHDEPVLWTRPCPFPVSSEEGVLVRYRLDPDPSPVDPRPGPGSMEHRWTTGVLRREARTWPKTTSSHPATVARFAALVILIGALGLGLLIGAMSLTS